MNKKKYIDCHVHLNLVIAPGNWRMWLIPLTMFFNLLVNIKKNSFLISFLVRASKYPDKKIA